MAPARDSAHAVSADLDATGGTVQGHLVNDGTINPGGSNAVGTLTVTSYYTQTASGTLIVDLAGVGVDAWAGAASVHRAAAVTNAAVRVLRSPLR